MPRVISRLPNSPAARLQVICPECIAVVSYRRDEVCGGGHHAEYITCPDCRSKIEIPEE
jgi:DNA-directed RNA polymerase subunit RPC12/RpoP